MSIAKDAKSPQTTRSAAITQVSHSFLNYSFVVPIFLSWLLFWGMGGSGSQKTPLMAGHDTPGARGTVSVKVGANMNTAVDLKVESLAQPDSLTPPANAYVVWIQPPGESPKNQGQIRVGVKENGELHTEVPYKRFKIFVTAEQNPQTQTPAGPQVLSGEIAGP
jgi:hypothetical protein